MGFDIQPLLEADTLDLVKLHYRAFENSIVPVLFSSAPSEASYAIMAAARANVLTLPRTRAFKAVETATGKMIAASFWRVAPEGLSQAELDSDGPGFKIYAPEQRVDAWKAVGKRLGECYAQTVGTAPSVELALLIVEPEWQGKGVGSKLLKWGLEEADRLGCVTYVEASDDGIRAYEKAGFKSVMTIDFDASPWTPNARFAVDLVMIREPKT